jgi:hypothetical protein
MIKKILLDLLDVAWPAVKVLLAGYLLVQARRLLPKLGVRVDADTQQRLIDSLFRGVESSVAAVYQEMVKPAKDPLRGDVQWTEALKHSAKEEAMRRARQVEAAAIESLKDLHVDVDLTLSQMVERAVVNLDAKLSTSDAIILKSASPTTDDRFGVRPLADAPTPMSALRKDSPR